MMDDYRYYSSIPPGSPTNLPDWEPTFTVSLENAGYAATDEDAHPEDAESEEAFAARLLGTAEDIVEEAPPEPEEEDDD